MNILGYDYTVVEDGDSDMIGAYGRYHGKNQVLQIASGLTEQQRVSTVLHEILEAINFHLQLKLEHNVIMSLETAVFQALTANGIDLSLLTKEIDGAGSS